MMSIRRAFLATASAAALVGMTAGLLPATAHAQAYPDRPIRLVVPYAAGGGTDAIARVIAQGMTEQLGQQLVVENNGTAGGNVATAQAAKADPDGYTLLMANQGPMTVNPHLFKNVKIDPLTAFDPVTLIAEAPLVVVVPEGSPFTNFQALVEKAKSNPGGLTYGSAGNGSASHLATLLLAQTAGLDMVHVPYKGAGPAITDLIGGRLDFMITTLPSVVGFLDSGKAKPLAVTMQERSARLPEVPTIAESGFPNYLAAAWYGFAVPKGTPPEIVAKLREATVAATKTDTVKRSLDVEGAVVIGNTPEEFGTFMQGEFAALGRADQDDRADHGLNCATSRNVADLSGTVREASNVELGLRSRAMWSAGWWWWRSAGCSCCSGASWRWARSFRMGPGYFPTILSWLMVALGGGDGRAGLAGAAPGGCVRRGAVARPGADRRGHAVLRAGLARAGPAAGAAGGGARHRLGQPLRQPQGLGRPGPGHRRVLLGPVHQGAGPAAAADRPLAAAAAYWSPPPPPPAPAPAPATAAPAQ